MDLSIEAYVIVPTYSHSNEMVIRNLLKFVSTFIIIYISNNKNGNFFVGHLVFQNG